jgi:hypothetical protein
MNRFSLAAMSPSVRKGVEQRPDEASVPAAKRRSGVTALLFLLLCLLWCLPAGAQNNTTAPQKEKKEEPEVVKKYKNAPQELVKGDKVPVMIVHNDTDSLGRRLIFTMRERLNTSDIFRLSGYNEKKLKIFISTQNEFKGRPGMSSIYAAAWAFSYGENLLSNFLESETGIIESQAMDAQAENLVARTYEIYSQYSYLFEEE